VTTKKNAPATPSDQGKKEDTLNKNANKSPAANQEKFQKPLTAGVAKEFIRLKEERPRYVPTNPYFQKAWSDFEARCRDVGVTDRSDINNFEESTPEPEQTVFGFIPTELTRVSWFKCLPRGHAFQMPLPGEANQKVVHEQQVFRTKWGYVSFYGPENIGYDVEESFCGYGRSMTGRNVMLSCHKSLIFWVTNEPIKTNTKERIIRNYNGC